MASPFLSLGLVECYDNDHAGTVNRRALPAWIVHICALNMLKCEKVELSSLMRPCVLRKKYVIVKKSLKTEKQVLELSASLTPRGWLFMST